MQPRPTPPDEDFHATLTAARRGEDWAWHELYQELIGPITGYVRSRGATDPDDMASEVFLQVAKGINHFDGDRSAFRSWVFVIAHRRIIDGRRKVRRRPRIADDEVEEMFGGDVEDEAMEQITSERVTKILEHLTPDQRDALALRVVADLSLAETAEILGKEAGAVKALQRRAILTLKRLHEEGRVSL